MNILMRVKNALETDGIREFVRKTYYKAVYAVANKKTVSYVLNTPIHYGLNEKIKREKKIIVSLTSMPQRFSAIYMCLKSLLLQDTKPDKIIVHFSNDTDEKNLTDEMFELKKYGIEYRFHRDFNLKPHGKYLWAMQEYQNDIIITADDDVIYPSHWITYMLETHYKFPEAICAWRVHYMRIDENKTFMPYNHWFDQYRKLKIPSKRLIATGVSGVLYPPASLPLETFNISDIISICLEADDIWLKCMEIKNQTKVVWVPNNEVYLAHTEKKQTVSLMAGNVDFNKNDILLNRTMNKLNLSVEDFYD